MSKNVFCKQADFWHLHDENSTSLEGTASFVIRRGAMSPVLHSFQPWPIGVGKFCIALSDFSEIKHW